jgi:hypothetical protein
MRLYTLAAVLYVFPMFASETVIARIGAQEIRYADVRCDAEATPDLCLQHERESFKHEIAEAIWRQACARDGWSPSAAMIAQYAPPYLTDERQVKDLAEKAYILPRLVRRVYVGEDERAVYEDAARVFPRLSRADFHREVGRWRSLTIVDRYLSVDPVVRFRKSGEAAGLRSAMQHYLHERIAARAAAAGEDYATEANAYLQTLVKILPIELLDDRFELPTGQEVFR